VTRALNEYLALRPLKPRISESRFSRAPLFTRRLLLRSRSLREKILAREPGDIVDRQEGARQEWLTQRAVRRQLPTALAAVARRDFDAARGYASRLTALHSSIVSFQRFASKLRLLSFPQRD